jgi:leucyl aminopeptidase
LSAALVVELHEGPIERIRTDLVIVGFAPEDRPLRRGAGRADWRLCGSLWNLISSEKLSGALGEVALLSARGALRAPLLLAVGLGPRGGLAVEAWRDLGRDAIARALGLRAESAVLDLAADAADAGSEATRALFCGAAMAVAERRARLRLVLTGDEAQARLSELGALTKQELPPGVDLRLSDSPARVARGSLIRPGDFRHAGFH